MGYLSSSNSQNNWVTVSGLNIPYGQWHHLAIAYSNNILKLYLDGILKLITPGNGVFSELNHMSIGRRQDNLGHLYN